MNYLEYEQYCADWWEQLHPQDTARVTEKGPHGEDGGIDIEIKTPNGVKFAQCKHYFREKVLKVTPVKELYADMKIRGVDEGVFFTSIPYSAHAREFAKRAHIWMQYLPDDI